MAVGRPREFDVDDALDAAVHLFWQQGYEGTSMTDLVGAMGVQRGSLYAAFGSKRELFDAALRRYQSTVSGFVGRALAATSAVELMETVLRGIVDVAGGEALPGGPTPRGCLFVHGALGTAPENDAVRDDLARRRLDGEAALAARLAELAAAGDPVASATDPELLSRWLGTVRSGLAVQARSGVDRAALHVVVDVLLSGPPLVAPVTTPPVSSPAMSAPSPGQGRETAVDDRTDDRPVGLGSVDDLRGASDDVVATFESRWVEVDGTRLHAVIGGEGPPVLLLAGWPQTWFAWRLVMPRLAREHTVVALDARGIGRSDMPATGYDTGTLAADAAAAMTELGHERFAVVGHDVGMWVAYALAADAPHRVRRLAVLDATIPGLAPPIPLFAPQPVIDRLWHFGFNRVQGVNEDLVVGRERVFVGYQLASKAARPLAPEAVDVYVGALAASREALAASFGPYRALDETMAQNERRRATPLTMPVLTLAGELSSGETVAATMRPVAADVEALVLEGCGHFPAEEAPAETADALLRFLAPTAP